MLYRAYCALWIVKSGDLAEQILTYENGDLPLPMQCPWNIYNCCIGIMKAVASLWLSFLSYEFPWDLAWKWQKL